MIIKNSVRTGYRKLLAKKKDGYAFRKKKKKLIKTALIRIRMKVI